MAHPHNTIRRSRGSILRRREQGFVLIMMGIAAAVMFGAMGLAVDVGRIFIIKNETQAFCDSAAVTAALQLDGTSAGITNATNVVTTTTNGLYFGGSNRYNFDTSTVSSPTVKFGAAATGPWYADAASLTSAGVALSTVSYAQVTSSVTASLYFVPVVMLRTANEKYTQTVAASAIAGQVAISSTANVSVGLVPFTGVASTSTGPNYGLVPGNQYDIQWPQYNGNRKGCGTSNSAAIEACFVANLCSGDQADTTAAGEVVSYWGSSINGYWGSNSAATINGEILDTKQLNTVYIGENLQPDLSSGNKASTQQSLDSRVNSDPANYETDYASYIADPNHNGQRLIAVPVVLPQSVGGTAESPVMTYGTFLLLTNASSGGTSDCYTKGANDATCPGKGLGNEPDCAIYVGPYNVGSTNGGVGSSSGMATHVRLMQ